MAVTVRDIIDRAGRKVHGIDVVLTGAEAAAMLDAFNDMLAAWKLDGIDIWGDNVTTVDGVEVALLPDYTINHAAYTENDTFPMPNTFIEGAAYCLAGRHAPEMQLAFDADAWLRKLQAAYAKVPLATIDPMLTYLGETRRRWYF